MKAYLITMLVLFVLAFFGTKRERDPYTDNEMSLSYLSHIALLAWTIYLLCQL